MIICEKKELVCWFPVDADGNSGMRRVKFARNYKGAIINYLGGGLVNFGAGLKFSGPAFRGGLQFVGAFGVLLNGFCVTEILSTA